MLLKCSLLFVLIVFTACKTDNGKQPISVDKIDSTTYVVINDLDNEPDRVIWQKPEMVLGLMGDLSGKTVADIGAGSGFFTFRLLQKAGKVVAVDIDTSALGRLKRLSSKLDTSLTNKLSIKVAKENDPELNGYAVDVMFLSNTYMYIKDRVEYLNNLKKYLSSAGRIIIVDYKKKNMPFGPKVSEKLDLSQIENELTLSGFKILRSDDVSLDYQYIVIAELAK